MKNFLYCMFIMTLLSIDSNAQPGNSISELRKVIYGLIWERFLNQ